MLEHGRDSGLLQHDFREPDLVRIICSPPRQIAPISPIPLQQVSAKGDDILCAEVSSRLHCVARLYFVFLKARQIRIANQNLHYSKTSLQRTQSFTEADTKEIGRKIS